MEKKRVLLTRKWSTHEAGEIIEEDAPCAESMIRKGYGVPYTARAAKKDKNAKGPVAETETLTPESETADARPQL
jgi:hypothetical protein